MGSKASKHEQIKNEDELRIVLVGKTGVGKSATGNTILGTKSFISKVSSSSVTAGCSKKAGKVNGQSLSIVDTPGLFDTKRSEEEIVKEIKKCICMSSPGPHVFLVVIQVGRFTPEEVDTVRIIQTTFGEEAECYTMVLFTNGDALEDSSIEQFVSDEKNLNHFVKQCKGGYHVFDNKNKDRSQVLELLQKVKKMMKVNGGSHYTEELFQLAEKSITEELIKILKQSPPPTLQEAKIIAEQNNTFIKEHPSAWVDVGVTAAGAGGSAAAGLTAGVGPVVKVSDQCKVQ